MFRKYIFLSGLLLSGVGTFAQRNCGSMDYLNLQMQTDPKRAAKLESIERATQEILESPYRVVNGIITIPVVVHVVYNTAAENISDAQVLSQIDVLNADFRRQNADADNVWPQAADSEIAFCMATVDPSGAATNGITRTNTSVTAFSTNDQVKFSNSGGKDAWPADKYLNVWVCDISGGILGYAQFPGGAATTDGVVIDYQYYGTIGTATAPFDRGRTGTHEVGHWLNLRHIWGDGPCNVDDLVADTPSSDAANYGCPIGHISCNTVDMVQNYMDYTDDACMNIYTTGQKSRMRALFEPGGARESLLTSNGCGNGAPAPTCNDGIQNGNENGIDCGGACPACPCNGTSLSLTLVFDNYPEETSWVIKDANNATVASGGTYGNRADGSTLIIPLCLADGCYTFTMNDAYGDGMCCNYGNGSYNLSGPNGTIASGGQYGASVSHNFCVGAEPAPTCNDGVQNGDETGIDCGGASCPPCDAGCNYVTINSNTFESGFGIWTDGGTDCARVSSAYSFSPSYSIRLRDDTNTSLMSTTNQNWTNYDEITVSFVFKTISFETNEDFFVQLSTNGGQTYTTKASYAAGVSFVNGTFYQVDLVIPGPFTSTTRLRVRADASADDDNIYIDSMVITGCLNNARLQESSLEEASAVIEEAEAISNINLFPNPANESIRVSYILAENSQVDLRLFDMRGRLIDQRSMVQAEGTQELVYETTSLEPGTYMLSLNNSKGMVTRRFVVVR